MSKEIAQTILQQLGGRRFIACTGSHSFSYEGPTLHFRVRRNPRNVNAVRITLTPSDLYKVEVLRIRGDQIKVIDIADDIFCDMLQDSFLQLTGLHASFSVAQHILWEA